MKWPLVVVVLGCVVLISIVILIVLFTRGSEAASDTQWPNELSSNINGIMKNPAKIMEKFRRYRMLAMSPAEETEFEWTLVPFGIQIDDFHLIMVGPPFAFNGQLICAFRTQNGASTDAVVSSPAPVSKVENAVISGAWLQRSVNRVHERILLTNMDGGFRGDHQRLATGGKWLWIQSGGGLSEERCTRTKRTPNSLLPKQLQYVSMGSVDSIVNSAQDAQFLQIAYRTQPTANTDETTALFSITHLSVSVAETGLCLQPHPLRPQAKSDSSTTAAPRRKSRETEALVVSGVIPRVIHQTFRRFQRGIPIGMWTTQARWQYLNPQHEMRFYSDAQCREHIHTNFSKSVLDCYDMLIPTAYQSDLFRACALYTHGGMYTDVKVFPDQDTPIDKMFGSTPTFVIDRVSNALYNGLVFVPPKHPVIGETINIITGLVSQHLKGRSPLAFGPSALGQAFLRVYDNAHHVLSTTKTACELELKRTSKFGGGTERVRLIFFLGKRRKWSGTTHFVGPQNQHLLDESYIGYRRDQRMFSRIPHYSTLWKRNYVFRKRLSTDVPGEHSGSPLLLQLFPTGLLLPRMASACLNWKTVTHEYKFVDEELMWKWLVNRNQAKQVTTYDALASGGSRALYGALCLLCVFGGVYVDPSVMLRNRSVATKLLERSKTDTIVSSEGGVADGRILAGPPRAKLFLSAKRLIEGFVERQGKAQIVLPHASFGLNISDVDSVLHTAKEVIFLDGYALASHSYKGFKEDMILAGVGEEFDAFFSGTALMTVRRPVSMAVGQHWWL